MSILLIEILKTIILLNIFCNSKTLIEKFYTGVCTSKSKNIDAAVTVLRLIHCHQLRILQTQINELICAIQKITANPKCDLNLGRIGR